MTLRVIKVKNPTPQTGGGDLWGIWDYAADCFINADGSHVSGFAAQLFPTEAEAQSAVALLMPESYPQG